MQLYEDSLREKGLPPDDIRPPRWQMSHEGFDGGSKDVACALCPIKHGVFKRTTDSANWVHLTCAYWQPEVCTWDDYVVDWFLLFGISFVLFTD